MKKLLFAIAINLSALSLPAQTSYITATGNIIVASGGIDEYVAPTIYVDHCYYDRHGVYLITLNLSGAVVSATAPVLKEYSLRATKADIDAYTGSGTGDTAKIQNAVDQYVVAYLQALNVSSTITIH